MASSAAFPSLAPAQSSMGGAAPSEDSEIEKLARAVFENPLSVIESGNLKERVTNLEIEQLGKFLSCMAQEIANGSNGEWIEKFFKLIPEERLNAVYDFDDSKKYAEALLHTAHSFLEAVQKQPPSSSKVYWENFLDVCVAVLEGFVSAFGIEGFFSPSESKFDSDMKGGRIMQLSALFGTLSAMLTPILGPTLSVAIVGGMIFSATSLSLIFPYVRPKPSRLLLANNWTKELQDGTISAPFGRKKTLDQISFTLLTSGGAKAHPMLIGKTGTGKTATVQAFTEAVARGDYPGLQGKTVFYFNTGDLKGADVMTGRNRIFDNIKKELGTHLENVIFVFDEIHQACQETSGTACKLGEQLKTRLDPQAGGFPLVIGITTEEEFFRDIYQSNPALARRFQKITIENPTDSELLAILTQEVLKKASEIVLELNILENLIQKTRKAFPKLPEPVTSLRILSLCIALVTNFQKSDLVEKKENLEEELDILAKLNALEIDKQRTQKINELLQELEELSLPLEREQEEREKFLTLRAQMLEMKKAVFQAVLDKKAPPAVLYFWQHSILENQKKKILQESKRLGIRALIDESLIDEVIGQELENEKTLQRILAAGKVQASERQNLH